jgi:hypothetical protein
MGIRFVGPLCARRDCRRPEWEDGLCVACRRLARLFGKDPGLFAYEPLRGYRDERDAVPLPWERLEAEAAAGGRSLADLLGERPRPER